MRSLRRQNQFIDYSFLSKFKNIVFLGLENEYSDLKKINNLSIMIAKIFRTCHDYKKLKTLLKFPFGYTIAEALKIPRLLESSPNFL